MSDEKKANEPNIIFVGTQESKGETVRAEPPASLTDGRDTFELPSASEQHKGFYHEQAGQIIRAFPKLYKRFQKKGAK